MLTRTHISRREGIALLLLIMLPLGVMTALAVRAAQNEQAAVHKSMRAELHRHASTASTSYERDIAQLEQQLREHHATEPNPAGPNPAGPKPIWRAQLAFARSVTLPPHKAPQATTGFATPMPSTAATHNRKACRRLAKTLSTTAKDAELARTFLDDCGAAQGTDGRYLWPLLALHPAARARPSPEELKRWLGKYGPQQSPAERAAQRLELQRADWLPKDVRDHLASAAEADATGGNSGQRIAHGKRLRDPATAKLHWNDPQSRGMLLRDSDGGYSGFVIDRTSLQHAITKGWPAAAHGVSATLTQNPLSAAHFVVLPGETSIALGWLDPSELSHRSRRSQQLLAASAGVAALGLLGLAWLLWSRLSAQRQLSALRTDFVAAVSHELRTPIASLRMLSELLADNKLEPEEVPEAQRRMVGEARRLGETVDRLLNFSRMQAGKSDSHRQRCDISQLMTKAVEVFEQRHDLSVIRDIAPAVEAEVDAAGVEMAVRNLLENARKHAPDGDPYQLTLTRQRDGLAISVTDHGPGIAERFQRTIFQPFERVDDRLSHATEGSGIGLSLVQHVAEAHGGHARVVSSVGDGATFTIWLPLP